MGGMLSQPITTKQIHSGSNDSLRWASCQMQGWRQYMEDAKITQLEIPGYPELSLFAVFDGHGGCEVAKYASNHFLEELVKRESFKEKNYANALKETFVRVDLSLKGKDAIQEQIKYKSETTKSNTVAAEDLAAGCTANVVLITPQKIYIANAGDSRSAMIQNNKSFALSQDHKPSLKRQQERVINSGGKIINGRVNGNLNLTRALGDFRERTVPNLPFDKQPITCLPQIKEVVRDGTEELLIVACDGIWERDYESNVDLLLRKFKKSLDENVASTKVLEDFFDENLSRTAGVPHGKDNMTAIVIQFLKRDKKQNGQVKEE